MSSPDFRRSFQEEPHAETGRRRIPQSADRFSETIPEMRTPEELYHVLRQRRASGADLGRIMDAYDAQKAVRERQRELERRRAVLAELPIRPSHIPEYRPESRPAPIGPRLSMAQSLERERRAGWYGEVIPNLTEDAELIEIEQSLPSFEYDRQASTRQERVPTPLPPRARVSDAYDLERRSGQYEIVPPNRAQTVDTSADIEDLTSEAEDWTGEDELRWRRAAYKRQNNT